MKFLRLFTVLIIVSFLSCQGDKTNDAQETSGEPTETVNPVNAVKEAPPAIGTHTGDTLNIGGKFVLFFGPADASGTVQSTSPAEIKNYQAVSSALIDSLSAKTDIKALYSSAGYFRILTADGNSMIINKGALNTDAGILITDGMQPPTIRKGIFSVSEYHDQIKKYFLLK